MGESRVEGRLAFPLRADAKTAPSTASHQAIDSQLGRDGQEVVSEKFYLNEDSEQRQPIVTIKKRRSIEIKHSANGAIQGFYDPQSGQSFLIADGLTTEAAPGVLAHQDGIHMAADTEDEVSAAGGLFSLRPLKWRTMRCLPATPSLTFQGPHILR